MANGFSPLGSALTTLAQGLPVAANQWDAEQERKRQAVIDAAKRQQSDEQHAASMAALAQTAKMNDMKIADEERTQAAQSQADTDLSRYGQAMQQLSQARDIGGDTALQPGGYAGPLRPEYQQGLSNLGKMDAIDQMKQFNIPQAAAYNEGAKSMLSTELAQDKMKKDPFGNTPTGLDLRFRNDPEYIQHQKDVLDGYLQTGKITPETHELFSKVIDTRPISWQNQIVPFLAAKERSQSLAETKTAEEIETERIAQEKAKADADKARREEQKAQEDADKTKRTADVVTAQTERNINNLISDFESKKASTGLVANTIADLYKPSEQGTVKGYFQQIKSSLTLKRLTDLKAAGGTLGALSDQERVMLDNAASTLDFGGNTERNIQALKDIKDILGAAKARTSVGNESPSTIKYFRDPKTGKLVRQ